MPKPEAGPHPANLSEGLQDLGQAMSQIVPLTNAINQAHAEFATAHAALYRNITELVR
jgi:hypothetical protein